MDQKFRAAAGQFIQYAGGQDHFRKFLPSVCYNIIISIFFSAADIQYQMFPSYGFYHFFQVFRVKSAIFKHETGDNHVGRSCIQVLFGVGIPDSSADL